MAEDREVVITGVGSVCPLGVGNQAVFHALSQQHSGVKSIPEWSETELPTRFGAPITDDFEPKQLIRPRKSLKIMCREIQMGVASATLALEHAGLEAEQIDSDRFGVVYASELFFGDLSEIEPVFRQCCEEGKFEFDKWGEQAMKHLYPLWMLKYLPNMAACHVGISHDARGPNNTITLGEVSSLLALAESRRVIQRGAADCMIAGGCGTRLNVNSYLFRGWHEVSTRNEAPEQASRPFDADRDGFVIGEGAASLMLESEQHATARGAKILGRILSIVSGFDPAPLDSPQHGDVTAQVIRRALRAAGIAPADVGHVNAHGLSHVLRDQIEARAIRAALGDCPVTAPKSYHGDMGPGSGAMELLVSLLGMQHDAIPPILNYTEADPACPINAIAGEPLKGANKIALVLNQNVEGQTVAAVIAGE
jgi:3-oxoacyl-[acyl-carrier-protein] synthase II